MKQLTLLMGLPGSGKTTFLKEHCYGKDDTAIISRDEIRLSILRDGDDFFSHEDEVFKEFVNQINKALKEKSNVYADATHISVFSRCKLMLSLDSTTLRSVKYINVLWLDTPLEKCIEYNNKRDGLARVPEEHIIKMKQSLTIPTREEGFCRIYRVKPDKRVEIIELEDYDTEV